jgi:hypothetical protein
MHIRLIGLFQVLDETGRDRTPRGAKSRALLAMLCQTPGHRRPRRWLEGRLWSDRGAEQASGSLRQALTELRKALGPLALLLESDRDCVALHGFATDLDNDPDEARAALLQGRDFLEGIDIHDNAFLEWLAEERVRVAVQLGLGPEIGVAGAGPMQRPPVTLRIASRPDEIEEGAVNDLASAIARLTAEYLLKDGAAAEWFVGRSALGLDVQVEGDWQEDGAFLKVRLAAPEKHGSRWAQSVGAGRAASAENEASLVVLSATVAA